MTPARGGEGSQEAGPFPSSAAAKASLLSWAEASDARKARARSSARAIAIRGAIAAASGLTLARLLTRHRRSLGGRVTRAGTGLLSWALVATAGRLVLPVVARAVVGKLLAGRRRHTPAQAGAGA